MACHDQIAPLLNEGVYFAHPASPWQRGTNANTNGFKPYLRERWNQGCTTATVLLAEIREQG